MKKLLTVLLIMIFAASFTLAQKKSYRSYSEDSSPLTIGAKFGLNFASWGGDNTTSLNSTTKLLFGGFIAYTIAQNFDMQAELLYNSVGTGISVANGGGTGNVGISYLEIATLAKYKIPVGPAVKIFFVAGPQLGIKLSANLHDDRTSTDTDISKDISGSDFDIVFGTGVMFRVGPGNINVDLRYNIGLSNVQKTSPPNNTNQVFSLAVGYGLFLN
jgi:hypothetical protein